MHVDRHEVRRRCSWWGYKSSVDSTPGVGLLILINKAFFTNPILTISCFFLQAIRNNLADVSAKDGSQETCVNLIASFLGIFVLSLFHDGRYVSDIFSIFSLL